MDRSFFRTNKTHYIDVYLKLGVDMEKGYFILAKTRNHYYEGVFHHTDVSPLCGTECVLKSVPCYYDKEKEGKVFWFHDHEGWDQEKFESFIKDLPKW